MRLIQLVLTGFLLIAGPAIGFAAGGASVQAIGFAASNERGGTDPQLAPYVSTLKSNLSYESFRYTGESSASVSPGAAASLSLPGGGRAEVQMENNGQIRVSRGNTVVTVSPGRPAVFLNGPPGRGNVSGVIIVAR